VVGHLPSKDEALNSIPTAVKKKKGERKEISKQMWRKRKSPVAINLQKAFRLFRPLWPP
jgi:hypothetical protein